MITAGIDYGAGNTKTVIMKDGCIMGRGKVPTGFDQEKAATDSWEAALKRAGLREKEVERICATGSGQEAFKKAGTLIDHIKALAKGARYFFPSARTVADVGAEEGRALKVDEQGEVVDFVVNERCAAGAGTFIEAMARALEVGLEEMGPLALESGEKIPMNAQCVIFAESEVVGLIHAKAQKADISKAIHDAMAGRIVSMIRRVGVQEDMVLMGGVGRNSALVEALKRELNLDAIYIPDEPEFGAAAGAALIAAEEA